jgi:hypothetical protein
VVVSFASEVEPLSLRFLEQSDFSPPGDDRVCSFQFYLSFFRSFAFAFFPSFALLSSRLL